MNDFRITPCFNCNCWDSDREGCTMAAPDRQYAYPLECKDEENGRKTMNNDLISRQAAIEAAWDFLASSPVIDAPGHEVGDDVEEVLKGVPSAQPKTGRWEPLFGTIGKVFKCSECGAAVTVAYECFKDGCYYDYCPNCGAKMKGEVE